METRSSSWDKFSKNIEASREYHARYHMAVANPVRRKILRKISEGKSENEIISELGISSEELKYHLRILERGFCIVKTHNNTWKLTKEGEVIDHL
jgi:predicted transcriptional regulator